VKKPTVKGGRNFGNCLFVADFCHNGKSSGTITYMKKPPNGFLRAATTLEYYRFLADFRPYRKFFDAVVHTKWSMAFVALVTENVKLK
jgi:hypothetical protein